MMIKLRGFVSILIIASIFCTSTFSQSRYSTIYNSSSSSQEKPVGGLITLYALDSLSSSLCFTDGQAGHVFQAYQVKNRCSNLDFGTYSPNSFTVGVQGNEQGVIVDLGNALELFERYKYLDGVGKKQGFASLHVENGQVVISGELYDLKARVKEPLRMHPLAESSMLFQKGKTLASAPVKLGHIYLIRVIDQGSIENKLIVKLLVVEFRPSESVTFRWEVL